MAISVKDKPVRRSQLERRAASRDRIIAKMTLLVGQRGVEGVRLLDLGQADKSLAVIYFKTKGGLVLEVIERLLPLLVGEFEVRSGQERLNAEINASFDFAERDPTGARAAAVLLTSITLQGAIRDRVEQAKLGSRRRLELGLQAAASSPAARANASLRAALIASSLQGAIALMLSDENFADRKSVRAEFTKSVLNGLGAKRVPPPRSTKETDTTDVRALLLKREGRLFE